jgi:hypothetical protein
MLLLTQIGTTRDGSATIPLARAVRSSAAPAPTPSSTAG